MLTRSQKETQVAELRERFARATSVFVADFRGLDVGSVDRLRERLRAEGRGAYEYRVIKNTLIRLAAQGSAAEALAAHFRGPTALAFSFGDPVQLAKILVDYAKQNHVFAVRGAVVEGRPLAAEQVATLATLPSLAQLRGKIAGLAQAPALKLVQLLAAPGGQLARLAAARARSLEQAAAGA
jgi:large subunit ribosomal protein L10